MSQNLWGGKSRIRWFPWSLREAGSGCHLIDLCLGAVYTRLDRQLQTCAQLSLGHRKRAWPSSLFYIDHEYHHGPLQTKWHQFTHAFRLHAILWSLDDRLRYSLLQLTTACRSAMKLICYMHATIPSAGVCRRQWLISWSWTTKNGLTLTLTSSRSWPRHMTLNSNTHQVQFQIRLTYQ